MNAPVETKVVAAAGGAGGGAVFAQFVAWLLGVTVWHVGFDADKAGDAVAAVPAPVYAMIALVVTILGGAIGGWLAPHTPRPAAPGVITLPADLLGQVHYVGPNEAVLKPPQPAEPAAAD